ncbi:fumarylacetoacetate hydrolase family protein [Telmatocola sphagniphila]|uniref:Fumarylacetoacetate hydrolase family protein n=1 Tax=Telmatocola sphagniphila TaxID=1123043 RepID=A0A8E6B643_9BACT|nr:fumarylacetoacetate hydrolase family protein [Telmatocola sphagniphila]QVL32174.1 fumarylacetoacetate hydrolase family protein [Telmatocola sphagniphila]
MQLAKVRLSTGEIRVGSLVGNKLQLFAPSTQLGLLLASTGPLKTAQELEKASTESVFVTDVRFLAPVDHQEVWAAGVTYKRSKIAREEESAGAAQFYDKVYSADRPELFLKAIAEKVVPPGEGVRIRKDSKWNVPEPELTLVVSPSKKIVGYTIGNDMSSRDIEGENPLYLPQAKIYNQSCSLGPVITLAESMPALSEVTIRLTIERAGQTAFEGSTSFSQFNRTPESLVQWLTKENDFPHGVLLLTGTGIVPPDSFSLAAGDEVSIEITGIGVLRNPVI